ncbi:hypothetical protein [Streptomyces sp. TR06-5]|uniref:hypothetical protein n=1 Tax=unclassified Streptomyces TaxID=2593676 RepID=UPI0039A24401
MRTARSAQEAQPASRYRTHPAGPGRSATPIYDALYAEYQRLFRALPGDRAGEEQLRFEGFGTWRDVGTGAWDTPPRRQLPALPAALPPAPGDGGRYGR